MVHFSSSIFGAEVSAVDISETYKYISTYNISV